MNFKIESLVNKFIVIIIMATVSGCATTSGYESMLKTWVGATEVDLIRVWGTPQSTYETNGSKFIVFQSNRNLTIPGTAPTLTTQYIGNTAITNAVGGSAASNIDFNCQTTFEVVQNRVVSWRWQGNDCRAIEKKSQVAIETKVDVTPASTSDRTVVKSTPTKPETADPVASVWADKSFISVSKGDWVEAIRTSTVAISLNPNLTSAYINRCWAYLRFGDIEEASKDCDRALQLEPKNSIALNNRGVVSESANDKTTALRSYELSCLADYELGCENFTRIAGYSPKNKTAAAEKFLDFAIQRFGESKWRESIELATRSVEVQPSSGALATRSGAYANLGLLLEAKIDAENAIKLNPNDAVAYNNLGFVLEKQKQEKHAYLQYAISCNLKSELGCSNMRRMRPN